VHLQRLEKILRINNQSIASIYFISMMDIMIIMCPDEDPKKKVGVVELKKGFEAPEKIRPGKKPAE